MKIAFISYAHIDAVDFVKQLNTDLSSSQISTWLDIQQIGGGANFIRKIENGLSNAVVLLAVLTPGYAISEWAQAEWNAALEARIPIIPLLLEDTTIPVILRPRQYIDFRNNYSNGIKELHFRLRNIYREHLITLEQELTQIELVQKTVNKPQLYQQKVIELKSAIELWKSKFSDTSQQLNFGLKKDEMFGNIFAGRTEQIQELNNLLNLCMDGTATSIFIEGEAGTGKTRLIEYFSQEVLARNSDIIFLVGRANQVSGSTDAYLPIKMILNQLIGNEDGNQQSLTLQNTSRLTGMLRRTGRFLVEVAPELIGSIIPGGGILATLAKMTAEERGMLDKLEEKANEVKDTPRSVDDTQISIQVLQLLEKLAIEQPLVFILDDLHWVDAPTANLLFTLIRELKGKILIIASYRRSEIETDEHPMRKLVMSAGRYGIKTIDLNKANVKEDSPIFEAFLSKIPNKFEQTFIDELRIRSCNHPFTLTQILSMLYQRGDIVLEDNHIWITKNKIDWTQIPEGLAAIFDYRLSLLEEEAREILRIGSVEGIDFTAETIARTQRLSSHSEIELIDLLSDDLVERYQLVDENGEIRVKQKVLSRFSFTHALLRDHIYKKLKQAQVRRLHQEVGEILEELYKDDINLVANQLRLHFEKSGDHHKMLHYTLIVVKNLFTTQTYAEATQILSSSIMILDNHWPDNYIEMESMYYLGELLRRQGKNKEVYTYLSRAEELARTLDNKPMRLKILISLLPRLINDNPDKRAEFQEEAIQLATELNDIANLARAYRAKAYYLTNYVDVQEALKLYIKAFELVENTSFYEEQIEILNALGLRYGGLGQTKKSIEIYNKAITLAKSNNNYYWIRQTVHNYATRLMYIGNYESAKLQYETVLEMAKKLGRDGSIAYVTALIGWVYEQQGNDIQAFNLYQESLKLTQNLNDRLNLMTIANRYLAGFYLKNKQYEKAHQILVPIKSALNPQEYLLGLLLAETSHQLKDHDQALIYIEKTVNSLKIRLESNPINFRFNHYYARALIVKAWILQDIDLSLQGLEQYKKAFNIACEAGSLNVEKMFLQRLTSNDPKEIVMPSLTFVEGLKPTPLD